MNDQQQLDIPDHDTTPNHSNDQLPDPSLTQRIVANLAGIAAYSILLVLGEILIISRTPPPFTWIPGFAFLFGSFIGYGAAREMMLTRSGVNSEPMRLPKVVKWLSGLAVVVTAQVFAGLFLAFLLVATPVHNLAGDYGLWAGSTRTSSQLQVAVPETSSPSRDPSSVVVRNSQAILSVMYDVRENDDLESLELALPKAVSLLKAYRYVLGTVDWPNAYEPAEADIMQSIDLLINGYSEVLEGLETNDTDLAIAGTEKSMAAEQALEPALQYILEE